MVNCLTKVHGTILQIIQEIHFCIFLGFGPTYKSLLDYYFFYYFTFSFTVKDGSYLFRLSLSMDSLIESI